MARHYFISGFLILTLFISIYCSEKETKPDWYHNELINYDVRIIKSINNELYVGGQIDDVESDNYSWYTYPSLLMKIYDSTKFQTIELENEMPIIYLTKGNDKMICGGIYYYFKKSLRKSLFSLEHGKRTR